MTELLDDERSGQNSVLVGRVRGCPESRDMIRYVPGHLRRVTGIPVRERPLHGEQVSIRLVHGCIAFSLDYEHRKHLPPLAHCVANEFSKGLTISFRSSHRSERL